MNTTIANMTKQIEDIICQHLSIDEMDEAHVETTSGTVQEIESRWNEFCRDLGHLSRDERRDVLARSASFRPRVIDGAVVILYNEVQVLKGKPRVSAAVVDLGHERMIFMGC